MVHISTHKMLALKLALVFIFLSSTCGFRLPVNSPEMVPHSQPSASDISPRKIVLPHWQDLSMTLSTPAEAVGTFAILPHHTNIRVSPRLPYTVVVRWKLAKGRQKSSPPVIPSAKTNPHWAKFEASLPKFLRSTVMKQSLGFADFKSKDDYARKIAIIYDHSGCSFQDAIGPPDGDTDTTQAVSPELGFELETSYSLIEMEVSCGGGTRPRKWGHHHAHGTL
ncbi:hypothetical protein EV361DRAFT_925592 [Lentinula raphanica]|nr:hypothetical protein F5880DRAFT_1281071 [Lentinula raphanica]KAJ3968488.1 hypothetical protein EV361DRAFT_925592 [Lentinula raphanica]